MLELEELKNRLKNTAQKFNDCLSYFDLFKLKERRAQLAKIQQSADLYKNLEKAQKINSEAKQISDTILDLETKQQEIDNLTELIQLLEQETDAEMVGEVDRLLTKLEEEIDILSLSTLLKGEYDDKNAILSIHAGAGGVEAMDWTGMLQRMYRMYAEKNGFSVEILDSLVGEEAGYKSITFLIKGKNAYGFLKAEKGVHRLVRISPFDSNSRRHTSFASVEVLPEIDSDINIKISPDELKIDTYRSSGAGGQHVNKTESAVRITHLPTGIVVQCQNQRSQIKNRETAMSMLKGRLAELRERELLEKQSSIKGELKKIEWGSQIRSYIFQPYSLVKDHRTGYEESDISKVMDGEIQEFIFDYLRKS